jgi:hypothetical protein
MSSAMMEFDDTGCVSYDSVITILYHMSGWHMYRIVPVAEWTRRSGWDLSAVLEYWCWYVLNLLTGSWWYRKHL